MRSGRRPDVDSQATATATSPWSPPSPSTVQVGIAPGTILADRYVVERELGRGGAAVVYSALDSLTRQRVALKVLDPHRFASPGSFDCLLRELRYARPVQHANVRRVFDAVEIGGLCLLTMEYAAGGSLRNELSSAPAHRSSVDPMDDALAIASGVAALHAAGLIHGDLKPDNILRMDDGRLVVSDVGLARAIGQTTAFTGFGGTPGYLAPEVVRGAPPSRAADVWALGVVLHELCIGHRPEWQTSLFGPKLRASQEGAGRRDSRLERVWRACLAEDPRRRPSTAEQVLTFLRSAPHNKWRRNNAVAAACCALALASAAFLLARRPMVNRPPARSASNTTAGSVAADWTQARLLLSRSGRCLRALPPDGKFVRVMTIDPDEAFDIEVLTGAYARGLCPGNFRHRVPRAVARRSKCPVRAPRRRGPDRNHVLVAPRRSRRRTGRRRTDAALVALRKTVRLRHGGRAARAR